MIRVLYLSTSTDMGGSEMMLHKLATRLDPNRFNTRVVSLLPTGDVGRLMAAAGIDVRSLNMTHGRPDPRALARLMALMAGFRPHILHTWLYHADFLGLVASGPFRRTRLVWSIRCAEMELLRYGRGTRWVRAACARLSGIPDVVLANSEAGRRLHRDLGYHPRRFDVIGNGFDTTVFEPDDTARQSVRAEWNVSPATPVIGHVGRFDWMKGHRLFVEAAGRLARIRPDVRFVMAGQGVDEDNTDLVRRIADNQLADSCRLLGKRTDMARVMNGLDFLCSSSLGEGFSNVIGEAMACGRPCIVTDVGDSASVVAHTGVVAIDTTPEVLAAAMDRALSWTPEQYAEKSRAARDRVVNEYSLDGVVGAHQDLYEELVGQQG